MTTILALDLSYTGTGMAIWRDGRVSLTTVRTRRPDHDRNGWEWPRRQRYILGPILEVLRRATPPVLVVKERRIESLDVAGASALDLAGLHAVVDYALAAKGVPIAGVNLTHLKSYATAKGNAPKDVVLRSAILELGPLIMPANHDEADALWLLAMAVHHYGAGDKMTRLAYDTSHRRTILGRIAWPVWATPAQLAETPTASRRTQPGAPSRQEASA